MESPTCLHIAIKDARSGFISSDSLVRRFLSGETFSKKQRKKRKKRFRLKKLSQRCLSRL